MLRTTLYIPESLHQRLQIVSKRKRKSVSKLAVELLDDALGQTEAENLNQVYKAWDQVRGSIKGGPQNLSESIDEVLYGKDGAWRGEQGEHGLWMLEGDK